MPTPARLLALLALPLAIATGPARAQTLAAPLTPAQAASLDRAIRLWTNSAAPYAITAQGDHYHLDKQPDLQSGPRGAQVLGGHLTAAVRPLDGGRWRFDDVTAGMPVVISIPAMRGQAATQTTIDVQGQHGHSIIDPSLGTPSTFDYAANGLTGTFNTPPAMVGSFRSGALTLHGVWQPVGPGRVDRSSAAALGDLALQVTGQLPVSITAADFHGEARFRGFSPDRFAAIMAFLRLNMPHAGSATPPAAKPASSALTAADRQAMHTALDQLRQVASGFDVDGALDDVAFVASGHTVRFRQIGMAEGLQAPAGKLALTYRMTFDGLTSPDIPAAMRDIVPHRLLISPRVSGVSVDALFSAIGAFIDDGVVDDRTPDTLQARGSGILAKGPLSIGLDALAFDVGPATLAGSGALRIAGTRPQDVTGTATLEVKGFSALLKRANTDPVLHSAAPVLIFLKGIGDESDPGTTVWKIVYEDGRVLVNGTDLSSMLPHNK